jgi:hypothetical protein
VASRLAGRLLTGSLAFLLAGIVDFVCYAIAAPRRARRRSRD